MKSRLNFGAGVICGVVLAIVIWAPSIEITAQPNVALLLRKYANPFTGRVEYRDRASGRIVFETSDDPPFGVAAASLASNNMLRVEFERLK